LLADSPPHVSVSEDVWIESGLLKLGYALFDKRPTGEDNNKSRGGMLMSMNVVSNLDPDGADFCHTEFNWEY
jgi:hypothetical protein